MYLFRKGFILLFALLFPVLVFLFLMFFGKNEYELSVYESSCTDIIDELRIKEFQNKYKTVSSDNDDKRSSAFGLAMRITTDLISGVIIGGIMGWSLVRLFGTEPWLLIVFFVFGVFAGISNVIRTAKKMNKLG